MKDLYRRIGIPSVSARSVIEAKLAAIPHGQDREDAAAVLLDDRRKEVYDRHLAVVRRVAVVREMAALGMTEFWNATEYGDFRRSRPAEGQPRSRTRPRSQDAPPHARSSNSGPPDQPVSGMGHALWSLLAKAVEWVVTILLLLGMVWLIGFVFETCTGPGEDSPDGGENRPKSGELDFNQNR